MNILITGKNSYIGESIKTHLTRFGHNVSDVDTIGNEWQKIDYSSYDSIVHVAAIVHNDAKIASPELFQKVNTQLPFEIAKLAKKSGVKQFVFISTMAVFGAEKSLTKEYSIVNSNTALNPISAYGQSKLQAEQLLKTLESDNFVLSIVRPPNVYGPNCRGNYIYLFRKLAKLLFVCPYAYTNIKQSMLYIDNLSELIRLVIENNSGGIYMPQDDYIPNTVDIITAIRKTIGKKTLNSKLLGKCVALFSKISIVNKIYGGVCYEETISNHFDNKYQIVPFEKGIELTYK